MLEMLISFSIFLVIVAFIPMLFRTILDQQSIDKRIQRMEWEVFHSQLKKELRMSDGISIHAKLTLERDGQSIVYEKYGQNIRRRVDLKGHEVVLQKVDQVSYTPIRNGVRIDVRDVFGNDHTATIRSFLNLEENDAK